MTPSTTAPRFGRAGGPSTQQVREYGDISTSSMVMTVAYTTDSHTLLLDASSASLGGDANSYYLIWGYSIATNATDPVFGYVESDFTAENIAAFGITAAGPMFQTFTMPIRLGAGEGVAARMAATIQTAKVTLIMIHYTWHKG